MYMQILLRLFGWFSTLFFSYFQGTMSLIWFHTACYGKCHWGILVCTQQGQKENCRISILMPMYPPKVKFWMKIWRCIPTKKSMSFTIYNIHFEFYRKMPQTHPVLHEIQLIW